MLRDGPASAAVFLLAAAYITAMWYIGFSIVDGMLFTAMVAFVAVVVAYTWEWLRYRK